MKKNNYKYLIYPLIIILCVLILSIFKINGSSVEIFKGIIFNTQERDYDSLFGRPRPIRSDQYLVNLPNMVSEDINNEPTINKDLGEGTNVITQNIPSRNIFALFRPTLLPFYFTNDTEFSYSFFWWTEIGLMLIGTYLLLLELTKKNLLISISGSLLFVMTPFAQWWNQTNMITWVSFGLFFFLKILQEKQWKISILYGGGLLYSIVTFVLLLYPPFQIPVVYIAFAIALGFSISKWKDFKANFKLSLPVLLLSLVFAFLFVFLFIEQYKDIINIISNTVYPGERFIQAGGGDKNLLFDGLYNILLQRDSNFAPFGNQSESSNFFLLFPPLIIWVFYKNILLFKKRKHLDWIAISISLVLIFFTANYFLPLPNVISRISLFYLIPYQRLLIGFGFGSYILMLYILFKDKIYAIGNKKMDWILAVVLSILYGLLTFIVGRNLYQTSSSFFKFPDFLSADLKIIGASFLGILLVFLLLKGQRKIFLSLILLFSFTSTVYINPIRKGLGILINTEMAHYIKQVSDKDDSKWIVFGDHRVAQYALANNANVFNGVHIYPQFQIWNKLDPDKIYIDIYNRYAHILVDEREGEDFNIELINPDTIKLSIDPCNSVLKDLGIKYVITTESLDNTSCLVKQKEIGKITVFYLK